MYHQISIRSASDQPRFYGRGWCPFVAVRFGVLPVLSSDVKLLSHCKRPSPIPCLPVHVHVPATCMYCPQCNLCVFSCVSQPDCCRCCTTTSCCQPPPPPLGLVIQRRRLQPTQATATFATTTAHGLLPTQLAHHYNCHHLHRRHQPAQPQHACRCLLRFLFCVLFSLLF